MAIPTRHFGILLALTIFSSVFALQPAMAEPVHEVPGDEEVSTGVEPRQTAKDTAKTIQLGSRTSSRVQSRIQNRVQNRIRNRIDQYYSPQANTASPFETASDNAKQPNRKKPK